MTEGRPVVSIVIPIYREATFLGATLTRLIAALDEYQLDYEVLLVEQYSDDATIEASRTVSARFPRVRYLLLEDPNYGLAMRIGMTSALGDIIVNFDIDYWDVTFVRMCVAAMLEFDVDIAIGSKNARLSVDNRSFSRRMISQAFRLLLQIGFGLRVSDTHGIKAWRRSPQLLQQIAACHFTHDVFDTELVIRCERAGLRLLELPVTVGEMRPPRSSIFTRIPGAAWNVLKLYAILQRESPKRSVPRGAINPRRQPEVEAINDAASSEAPHTDGVVLTVTTDPLGS